MSTKKKLVVGVVIPTRGDRPELLERAILYSERQTLEHHLIIVDRPPKRIGVDIVDRYREGLLRARELGCDVVALCEDDDWYDSEYLEWGVKKWEELGRPNVFGIPYTYYYHIGSKKYVRLDHAGRSSAMCTFVVPLPVLNMRWPHESNPFLDLHIWKALGGVTAVPDRVMAVGIKHGVGMSGGSAHSANWIGYTNADKDGKWLRSIVGGNDAEFYARQGAEKR